MRGAPSGHPASPRPTSRSALPVGSAEDEVHSLRAYKGTASDGTPVFITRWKPTAEAIERMIDTGELWLWTYGTAFPPVLLDVEPPTFIQGDPEDEA